MKTPATTLMIAFGLFIAWGCQYNPTQEQIVGPLKRGDLFPQITMSVPTQPEDRRYLGLFDSDKFTLMDVKADVVFLEILNTHCFSCKKQARLNKKLFELINSDLSKKERIKIFGIAVGNDANEVQTYKKEYNILYPIIPDPDFRIHGAIGVSKTPYSIYIRKEPTTGSGLIMGTHLGPNLFYEELFDQLSAMLSEQLPPVLSTELAEETHPEAAVQQLSKNEMEVRMNAAFESIGGTLVHIKEILSPDSGHVYAGKLKKGGEIQRLFGVIENRTVPCDVCHDADFLYVFDDTGKVLLFQSIRLSKYDNLPWDENDISLIRSRIVGKYIFHHIPYYPKVDAVSSATITTAVIYDSMSKGYKIYEVLKEKGLLK